MGLSDRICDFLVVDKPSSHEESLPTSFCHLDGLDVGQGDITDIDIEVAVSSGWLVLGGALGEVPESLVRGVDGVQGVQVAHNRAEDKRRVDRGNVEIGLFLFNKFPRSLLRKSLAASVDYRGIQGFFPGDWVPVLLTVGWRVLLGIDNRSKRGCDDDSLHRRCMGFDSLEDARGSLDGGIQEVLNGVLDIEVEGRSSVQDIFERRV